MFGDINRVELLGNITSDPELKYTSGGTSVLNIGMATNRRIRKNDEWVDETDFHNLVFWGNLATNLASRIRKGTRLFAAGRLQTRSWEDDSGKKNYRTEIHVVGNQDVVLIARYEGAKGESASDSNSSNNSFQSQQSTSNSNQEVEIDPDDLPF